MRSATPARAPQSSLREAIQRPYASVAASAPRCAAPQPPGDCNEQSERDNDRRRDARQLAVADHMDRHEIRDRLEISTVVHRTCQYRHGATLAWSELERPASGAFGAAPARARVDRNLDARRHAALV